MNHAWTQADREQAYTALCEAITASGARESLFLARLVLLLAEELRDAPKFARCLADASNSEQVTQSR